MRIVLRISAIVLCSVLAGCPADKDVPCEADSNCNLLPNGVCAAAGTGRSWCAYQDEECASERRFAEEGVGDGLAGVCTEPQLTLTIGGDGAGTVVSSPAGIACSNGMCSGAFPADANVELTATASSGVFLGWSEACRGSRSCTVTMDQNQLVRATFGTPGATLWAKQFGGSAFEDGNAITVDRDGNIIVVGNFEMSLPGTGLQSLGFQDAYVIKLDGPTREVLWAKRIGGAANDLADKVSLDGQGNIYVMGRFQGTVDFGNGPRQQTAGAWDSYVLKLDPAGVFQWVRTIGGRNL